MTALTSGGGWMLLELERYRKAGTTSAVANGREPLGTATMR
jgi:hypothetical protein